VRYYLRKGQTEKARAIADFAGEVYSYSGLIAKGVFLECNSNYDGALEWFGKIEERSDTPFPLVAYCVRYKSATGDARFDGEVRKRIKVFPKRAAIFRTQMIPTASMAHHARVKPEHLGLRNNLAPTARGERTD
jgi:hypothetical protein